MQGENRRLVDVHYSFWTGRADQNWHARHYPVLIQAFKFPASIIKTQESMFAKFIWREDACLGLGEYL